MSVDSTCCRLVHDVEGALASLVIDIASKRTIGGFFRGARMPIERPEAVVALVHGTGADRIAERISLGATTRSPSEVHVTTAGEHHIAKTIDEGRAILVLVAAHDANVGLAWAQLGAAVAALEPMIVDWRTTEDNEAASKKLVAG